MSGFTIYVLATSDVATLRALHEAAARVRDSGGRILLIVPRVVSFRQALDSPVLDAVSIAEHFRELAATAGVEATVRVCLCREPQHVFDRLLLRHVDVVIGGRRGFWRKTREEKIARALVGDGHAVTFTEATRPSGNLAPELDAQLGSAS